MQSESPKTQTLVRLDRIAEDINSKYGEAIRFADESARTGNAAVVAAIECGKMLTKAKELVGHGGWEKWLLDWCGNISHDTSCRWMKMAKIAHVQDLSNCKNITRAYIACGIIPDPAKKAAAALGTAEVDIFQTFVGQIQRECDRIESLSNGVELSSMPPERKDEVRAAIAKVKEIEGRL